MQAMKLSWQPNEKRMRNLSAEGRPAGEGQCKGEAEGYSQRWVLGTLPSRGVRRLLGEHVPPKVKGRTWALRMEAAFSRVNSFG